MPIVLDKQVVSSPSINDAIAGQGQITGDFTASEARTLEAQLKSGALPVQLAVVGQTLIGPTLGGESVDAAVRGGVLGLVVVMIFMLLYYRMPGLLADVALLLYALLTLALFRLLPVTLTLAGIAGFVLSIGMAVDANILIFERMKEELRAGRRIRSAMDTGFSRAWPSIRDSNMSTLITCAILFWFGSQFGASIVKGFAVTLALGVVTSLFTAITVTRTLLKLANRFVLREAVGVEALESPRLRSLFGF
jgi:preprotein translocase subunit SecD